MSIIRKEEKWNKKKEVLLRELEIKKEKDEINKAFGKKISTSKLLIFFLFINCSLIELFTGYITIKSIYLAEITLMSPDFTPLITLIGSVVGEVIGFAIYAIKSAKENTAGGIVYETTMAGLNNDYGYEEDDDKEDSTDNI